METLATEFNEANEVLETLSIEISDDTEKLKTLANEVNDATEGLKTLATEVNNATIFNETTEANESSDASDIVTERITVFRSKVEKKLLHYTGKAIHDYKMIEAHDRVMVCLSGGKDSYTLLSILKLLQQRARIKFEIFAFTLDQAQPGFDDSGLRAFLEKEQIPYEVLTRDTYSIVKEKIPEGATYCGLCSRLRRGIIYRYAEENGFNKIALGHHRDDLIRTLLMSIMYNGEIKSMPPKLLSDNKKHIVIRPLAFCQEQDIITYAKERKFPIIPCNLCGSQDNLARVRVKKLIDDLAKENPKIPSNMLHALQNIKPSQLMDQRHWDFDQLETERV